MLVKPSLECNDDLGKHVIPQCILYKYVESLSLQIMLNLFIFSSSLQKPKTQPANDISKKTQSIGTFNSPKISK